MLQQCPTAADNAALRKRVQRPCTYVNRRSHSVSPPGTNSAFNRTVTERRCQSSSPLCQSLKKRDDKEQLPETCHSVPVALNTNQTEEKNIAISQCLLTKLTRALTTKKRDFMKLRKSVITQQNVLLEQFAALKEMEKRAGLSTDESVGDVRLVSVSKWPAHDLLMLIREECDNTLLPDVGGNMGPQVFQQLSAQLNSIPEEFYTVASHLLDRRNDLLNLLRCKQRAERANYMTNLEWKTKNAEFDQETQQLVNMVSGTNENLKAKIIYVLDLAKIPWLDRDKLIKKIEKLQKELVVAQHKLEDGLKKDGEESIKSGVKSDTEFNDKALQEELQKERSARESLKEVVTSAESMLRVARARIATLEKQIKEAKADLETARRKNKDLEQLYRHRETSYDARSKKLMEVSKTGEMTIEALSRQRDALELRVKELREQAEQAERDAESKQYEQRARADMLQAKVAEQEKGLNAAEVRNIELEARVKELQEQLQTMRDRSTKLLNIERRRCLGYLPVKEIEPTERETEIWKELQITRVALARAEEELRQSKSDKDNFLNSLSKIAQEGNTNEKLATELLERERKIAKLQKEIEEQQENEKMMEQSMTQYENQLAELRLEVKRLRNYDYFVKEAPLQELQNELLELQMKVASLSRERSALVTAAASRALMLERHDRAADLFARMIRVRRDLAVLIDGRTEPPPLDEVNQAEISRSLSSICGTAAETWSALRAERTRVLKLERAVLTQSLQLEREGRARTQLERRRAFLERVILRPRDEQSQNANTSEPMSFGRRAMKNLFRS